jgi:lysophospholipase L1-like esterase
MKRKTSHYENKFTGGSNYLKLITSGITLIFILSAVTILANNLNLTKSVQENTLENLISQSENKYARKTKPLPDAKKLWTKALVSGGDQSRLQAVFAKAQKGEKITLGVIGGSITRAGAKIAIDKRYANVMLAWWQKTFPKTKFELINAGMGATRSDYGAMRAKHDLLSNSPDFVILEFACNDLDTPEYAESYEGMVRQILSSENKPALMLLFMTRKDGTNVQAPEIKIGSHYQLPMISYRNAIWAEMQAGRLEWDQICRDEVHPNEAGHALAGGLLCETLKKAFRKFKPNQISSIAELPAPLYSNAFEYTSLDDGETLIPVTNHGWTFDNSGKDNVGWKSSVPGSILEFEISGTQIYLSFWKVNGPMGKAKIQIDKNEPVEMDAWFDQTWGGYRNMELIGNKLSPGKHLVRIELLADKNKNSTGNEFRVLCLGSTETDHNQHSENRSMAK